MMSNSNYSIGLQRL